MRCVCSPRLKLTPSTAIIRWQHKHPKTNNSVYRGGWVAGRMHGCGVLLARAPGTDAVAALEGRWAADEYIGPIMPCAGGGAFEAGVDADVAAYQARSFQLSRLRGAANGAAGGGAAAAAAAATAAKAGSSIGRQQQPEKQQQQKWRWPWSSSSGYGGGGGTTSASAATTAAAAGRESLPPEARARVAGVLSRMVEADARRAAAGAQQQGRGR